MQYAVEIDSVLAERVEQEAGGFIGIRCVHMDGCGGSSRANTKCSSQLVGAIFLMA